MVLISHSLHLSAEHPDYRFDIQGLRRATEAMLKNALEDYEDSEPFVPDVEDDDLDDEGMGAAHGA